MRGLPGFLLTMACLAAIASGCGSVDGDKSTGGSVNPPTTSVTREEALAVVRTRVLQPLAADRFVLALCPQTPLAAGTTITPLYLRDDVPVANQTLTATANSWFVLIDLVPTHRFGHPVRYLLVNAETKAVTEFTAYAPPVVGETVLYATDRERFTSQDRFHPASNQEVLPPVVPVTPARNARSLPLLPPSAAVDQGRAGSRQMGQKVAIVVATATDTDIENDAQRAETTLKACGFTVQHFKASTHKITDVYAAIKTVGPTLCALSKFTLYISGHALNEKRLEYGPGVAKAAMWNYFPADPNSITRLLKDHVKAGHINIVVDACFSGGLIPFVKTAFAGDSREVCVFAATDADKTAAGACALETVADWFGLCTAGGAYSTFALDLLDAALAAGTVDSNGDGTISIAEFEAAFTDAFLRAEAHLAVTDENPGNQNPQSAFLNRK